MRKISLFFITILLIISLTSCDLLESDDGPFTISFNSNGGTSINSIEVHPLKPFIPKVIPTKEGYMFAGWYIDETLLYPMSFHVGANSHLTLYAKWIAEDTTLTDLDIAQLVNLILNHENFQVLDEETLMILLENVDLMLALEKHITSMVKKAYPSVVMIETYHDGSVDGGGSGIIYKRVGSTYYVLTNEHVVNGYTQNNIALTLFSDEGETYIARGSVTLKKKSQLHDMAVLTFTSTKDISVIEMGSVNDLAVGQFVYAIGSPLDLPNSLSMGIISSLNRPMSDGVFNSTTIQHTAAINPGSSGGALIDRLGRLIGLNTISYVDQSVGEGIEGLHFAVQIDIILSILPTLES